MTTLQLLRKPLIEPGQPSDLERLKEMFKDIKQEVFSCRLKADKALASNYQTSYEDWRARVNELEFKLETCRQLLSKFN